MIKTYRDVSHTNGRDLCAAHAPTVISFMIEVSEEREGTCLVCARELMARILPRSKVADSLRNLLAERKALYAAGRSADARRVDQTIEDMAGHWHDGKFVGARQIADASEVTS